MTQKMGLVLVFALLATQTAFAQWNFNNIGNLNSNVFANQDSDEATTSTEWTTTVETTAEKTTTDSPATVHPGTQAIEPEDPDDPSDDDFDPEAGAAEADANLGSSVGATTIAGGDLITIAAGEADDGAEEDDAGPDGDGSAEEVPEPGLRRGYTRRNKYASFEKGKKFQLKQFATGKCVSFQEGYGLEVYDPKIRRNTKRTVAYLADCNANDKNQFFTYNSMRQLVAGKKCLAPLASANKEAFPSGGPCNRNQLNGEGGLGAMMFAVNCDHRGWWTYQKWSVDGGVVQSACDHGMHIGAKSVDSGDDLMLTLVERDNSESNMGYNFVKFGNSAYLPGDTLDTPSKILNQFVNSASVWKQITNHGCWCGKMNSHLSFTGGPNTVDELDQLCKEWYVSRRCNGAKDQPCHKTADGNLAYGILQNENEYPWTKADQPAGNNCDSLNSIPCAKKTCELDAYWAGKIKTWIEDNKDSWAQIMGSRILCPKTFYMTRTISNPGNNLNECSGTWPNMKPIMSSRPGL